jgi:RNA polymerase sigma-54 factor
MNMRQSLQIRLSQQLTLTPQLQQSIRLLQLSTLELQQEIEQALVENPMLEQVEDSATSGVRLVGDSLVKDAPPPENYESEQQPASATTEAKETERSNELDSDLSYGTESWGNDWSEDNRGSDDDEKSQPQVAGKSISLTEHLTEQLRLTSSSTRDIALVSILIDLLNDDGYLNDDLEGIYQTLPEDLEIAPEELTTALKLLQSFDPAGIAARNASECLKLQLLARHDELKEEPEYPYAMAIVERHLELLAQKEFVKLKKVLGINDEMLRQAQILIKSLDPFPGARFSQASENYVIPDIIVRKVKARWVVTLNNDVMPKLKVNEIYAQILKGQRGQGGTQLSAQLQEARWLIKNIQQRFDTILRVSQAIVETQQAFFNHGEIAMQPLVLREIAERLGLHESTVSRVTNQKYMLTPFGTFELKYFFGSHVSTDTGGSASSTAIRALLKQFITAEDPKHPLSDSQLADLFSQQGIVVARRTVAKYRESLRIPPVNLRKTL